MKHFFSICLLIACASIGANAQYVTTNSTDGVCPGGQAIFYIMPGSNCGSPQVAMSGWKVKLGSTSTEATGVSIEYIQTGSYYNQIRLIFPVPAGAYQDYTISASYGCGSGSGGDASYSSFRVYAPIATTLSITPDKTQACVGESITFTPTSNVTPQNYQWSINGVDVSGATGSTFSTALNQNDQVRVRIGTLTMCASPGSKTSDPVTVQINQPVPVTVYITSPKTTICTGEGIGFTASITNGGDTPTVQWRIDGSSANVPPSDINNGPLYLIYTNGSFLNNKSVQCYVTSSTGCSTPGISNSIPVTVTPQQTLGVNISILPDRTPKEYCKDEISFQADPTHPATVDWYVNTQYRTSGLTFDPVEIMDTDVVSVVATPSGTQSCLAPTPANAQLNSGSFTLKAPVNASPIQCTGCVTSGIIYLCQNPANTDFNSDITSESSYSWTLDNPAAGSWNSSTGVVDWNDTFTGQVKIKLNAQGCNGPVDRERTIEINQAVTLSISVSPNKTDVCYEEGIMFHATHSLQSEPDNQFSLLWEVNNGGNWIPAPATNAPQMGKNYLSIPWQYQTNSRLRVTLTTSKSCPLPSSATGETQNIVVRAKEAFSITAGTEPSRFPQDYCESEISFKANPSHPVSEIYWYKNGAGPVQSGTLTYDPVSISSTDVISVSATPALNACVIPTGSSATVPSFRIKGNLYIQPLTCGDCTPFRCTNETDPTDFNSSVQNPENDQITWAIENAELSEIDQNGVVTWDPEFTTGTATIRLSGTGCNGLQEQTKEITMRTTVPRPTAILSGPDFVCPNGYASFSFDNVENGGSAPSYSFYVNGEQVSNSEPGIPYDMLVFPHWPYISGLNVKVVIENTDDDVCFAEGDGIGESNWIKVYTELENVVTLTAEGGGEYCQNSSETQVTASPDITPYEWSINAGISTIDNNGLITWDPSFSGTAYVTIQAEGCPTATLTSPITIIQAPPTPENQQLIFCGYEAVTLTTESSTGFIRWYEGSNPEPISTSHKLELGKISLSGTYHYFVEVLSNSGCTSIERADLMIIVNNECDDDKLNWTQAQGFNPDIEIFADSKLYFDYTGRALQSQTKIFQESSTNVMVAQGLRDRLNRSVGSTLPAPTPATTFNFNSRFVNSESGEYNFEYFDNPQNNTVTSPAPVDNTWIGSLGWYYSELNTIEESRPVTGYPYSRVDFYDDGSGEVRRASREGEALRMGSGHEVISGTFPVYNQLYWYHYRRNELFPSTLPEGEAYGVQSIIRDENGIYSGSISDRAGRTIMTFRPATEYVSGEEYKSIQYFEDHIFINGNPQSQAFMPEALFYACHDDKYINIIKESGDVIFENIITGERTQPGETFEDENGRWPSGFYKAIAASPDSEVEIEYTNYIAEITYNFYDDAGRLVSSVSPNGVEALEGGTREYSDIDKTTYRYNYAGQIILMTEPDAGTTRYLYRKDGKIKFSQSAVQLANESIAGKGKFSYTNYDELGRATESGEFIEAYSMLDDIDEFQELATMVENNLEVDEIYKKDWIKTHYDVTWVSVTHPTVPETLLPNLPGEFRQEFVRGGVSWSENENNTTWYSYDEFGRLVWMAQKPTALNRTFVSRYTYDFAGNVLTVVNESYENQQLIAPFYHHYDYDKNHRLHKVYTSTDGNSKTLRATYQYYLHGPLKRIVMGDNIQGVDFVYNIHGWLTQINNPNNPVDTKGAADDAFAMVIDYYESALEGIFQTSGVLNRSEQKPYAQSSTPFFKELLRENYKMNKDKF